MKKVIVLVVLMVLGYTIQAQGASLTTIGTATYSGSDYNLIWDDDNNGNSVVWLDYRNSGEDWTSQNTWAAGLNGAGVLTYNIDPGYAVTWNGDWRLPTTPDVSSSAGDNKTDSEMGHLYYTELGNSAGGPLSNTGDFQNLSAFVYWSGTEFANKPGIAWRFGFDDGNQGTNIKSYNLYGLAVRSGDVAAADPVPEPATIALLGIGLAGMAGYGVRRRRQRR